MGNEWGVEYARPAAGVFGPIHPDLLKTSHIIMGPNGLGPPGNDKQPEQLQRPERPERPERSERFDPRSRGIQGTNVRFYNASGGDKISPNRLKRPLDSPKAMADARLRLLSRGEYRRVELSGLSGPIGVSGPPSPIPTGPASLANKIGPKYTGSAGSAGSASSGIVGFGGPPEGAGSIGLKGPADSRLVSTPNGSAKVVNDAEINAARAEMTKPVKLTQVTANAAPLGQTDQVGLIPPPLQGETFLDYIKRFTKFSELFWSLKERTKTFSFNPMKDKAPLIFLSGKFMYAMYETFSQNMSPDKQLDEWKNFAKLPIHIFVVPEFYSRDEHIVEKIWTSLGMCTSEDQNLGTIIPSEEEWIYVVYKKYNKHLDRLVKVILLCYTSSFPSMKELVGDFNVYL